MTSVRLEPAAPPSRVRHSSTEPLCSLEVLSYLLLKSNISSSKNSADQDQLSSEKPTDQDLHFFFRNNHEKITLVDRNLLG